ncbi:MAG: ArgE/DapE family deacylase [Gammaproteobacteria bacterium]|nr:ArgE/DapE family deacylase [Gammaproteobacteria bacterium]
MNLITSRIIAQFTTTHAAAQQRFLAELVSVPSDNPPGDCAPHSERTANLLEALGFDVECHPVPAEVCQANGMTSVTNLIVRRHYGQGHTVALNAHGDVVPPGEGWHHGPYDATIQDGWMYGRGVAVSKSDIATYAYAVLALEHAGVPLTGNVELHVTYDEETGGNTGPRWLLDAGLTRPDYVISAGFSYGVITAHNGCIHLEIRISGRSAHAAKPETGADALEAASRIMAALYGNRWHYSSKKSTIEGITSPTLVIGLVEGGINTNVVPDRAVLRLDRRIIPEENSADMEAELRELVTSAVNDLPGIQVETDRILLAEPFIPVEGSKQLAMTLSRIAGEVFDCPVPCHGVPIYTDARHYASNGIPTVIYGAGPETIELANAHRANERLRLADLPKATQVVARTLGELLIDPCSQMK